MKHFPQYMQLLRAAWDGDRAGSEECAQTLAAQLEDEGDTAHARMLRFTMQTLMSRAPTGAAVPAAQRTRARITTHAGASLLPLGEAPADEAGIELTFGRWDDADATTW